MTIRTVCGDCGGTGLYVGMGERDGAAVVCWKCSGTGCAEIKYTPFQVRASRDDVRRVFKRTNGICIGEGGDLCLADFGGMPYDDWAAGEPFPDGSEDRAHVCPAWWDRCEAADRGIKCPTHAGQRYSDCSSFIRKAECWNKWDRG